MGGFCSCPLAAPEDLAAWSGLKINEAREAWRLVAGEITSLETTSGSLWLRTDRLSWLDELSLPMPYVRLLPGFDNILIGYASRDWVCPPAYAKRINPGGGMIHPALIVNGAVKGSWKAVRRKEALEIQLEPFEPLDPSLRPALEAEVADIARFLDLPALLA